MTHYLAHGLTEEAREEILRCFPPKFPNVKAHHVTELFDVPADTATLDKQVTVLAYCCDESLEALVVTVGGNLVRPDGNAYHLTLSYDASKGRESSHSNALLAHPDTIYQPVLPQDIDAVSQVVLRDC